MFETNNGVPGVAVRGEFVASALGMIDAIERIQRALEGLGWNVQAFNADTSGGWFEVLPKSRTLNVKLHRRDRPYSPAEAAAALRSAVAPEGWDLDLVGSYQSELAAEVVLPTIRDTGKAVGGALDAATEGVGLPSWAWKVGAAVLGIGVVGYTLAQVRAFVPKGS